MSHKKLFMSFSIYVAHTVMCSAPPWRITAIPYRVFFILQRHTQLWVKGFSIGLFPVRKKNRTPSECCQSYAIVLPRSETLVWKIYEITTSCWKAAALNTTFCSVHRTVWTFNHLPSERKSIRLLKLFGKFKFDLYSSIRKKMSKE